MTHCHCDSYRVRNSQRQFLGKCPGEGNLTRIATPEVAQCKVWILCGQDNATGYAINELESFDVGGKASST